MSEPFSELGDAISDQRFVDVDLALRRGQHIDHDDADWYAFLLDAQATLEPFYRRYGCELIHRSDGYFFLLPTGDKVAKRLLGVPEMIVGQGAALLYLDPSTIESGGVVSKEDLLSHLAAVMGTDALVAVFNPKRKRMDERVAQETVRQRVGEGLRKLTQLGFVTVSEDNRVRLRSALMRFADPVRGAGSPREALEKLIARGEVSIPSEPADENDDEPPDADVGASKADPRPHIEPNDDNDPNSADGELEVDEGEADDAEAYPPEDEYVFDREYGDDDDDGVSEQSEDSVERELADGLDGSFGLDFDEVSTSKDNSLPALPTQDLPPAPPPKNTRSSRTKRKRESVHPEADSSVPSSDKELAFDEFD